jgi:hypothetical protein
MRRSRSSICGSTYNKHHRRQIIRIPTRGDLAQAGGDACFERFHPVIGVLVVVDGDPLVAGAQPVALAVVVREGVVVFEAVFEHELGAFLGGFPPGFLEGAVSERGEGVGLLGGGAFTRVRRCREGVCRVGIR